MSVSLAHRLPLLESKVKLYEQELINLRSTRYTLESIIGNSQVIQTLKDEALRASANELPVLISGESGTGKELFAQAIHHASPGKCIPSCGSTARPSPRTCLNPSFSAMKKGPLPARAPAANREI